MKLSETPAATLRGSLDAVLPSSTEHARTVFLDALDRHLEGGTLHVRWPGGARKVGRGEDGPVYELVVTEPRFFRRVLALGNLGMGESFMDEDFHVPEGKLPEVLTLLLRNRLRERFRGDPRLLANVAFIWGQNALRGAWRNVQSHYDIGDDLFESFLDETLTYSCGYATSWDDDVAKLQHAKLDRICKKLRLEREQVLLDIGCGFAGLLIFAATHYGVRGTGITLSKRHCALGRERVARAGLAEKIELRLESFHDLQGSRFDRIVSVGMLEHVARRDYPRYFDCIQRSLAPGGLALVHTIGCGVAVNEHDPFTQRYIFPGSALPKLSEIADEAEKRRLPVLDVENLHRHYAPTARRWLERFLANRGALPPRYDARFQRMWEYYLSCCIAAATAGEVALYQVLLGNDFAGDRPWARV